MRSRSPLAISTEAAVPPRENVTTHAEGLGLGTVLSGTVRIAFVMGLLLIGALGCFGESRSARLERLEAAGLGLDVLVAEAQAWVRNERDAHRPLARELAAGERRRLEPYFEGHLLDAVRVREVGRLENPGFFDRFTAAGEPLPMDFRQASGLALNDTVLVVDSRLSIGLLFHELVHVAQDAHLGSEAYMEAYVRGWAENGFEYRSIPQEAQAYELTSRFAVGGEAFPVAEEVARRFPNR